MNEWICYTTSVKSTTNSLFHYFVVPADDDRLAYCNGQLLRQLLNC